jgi:hypothetical protein
MKRLLTIACLLLCIPFTGLAQEDSSFAFVQSIKGSYADFWVDNLDNLYLLGRDNQLKKISARGDSMGVFNDVRRYGKLSFADVSNPLKIQLYYKNFGTIVSLDRFLQPRNVLDLRKQNLFRVKAVATSYDNNLWVVDEQDCKLKKLDETGKTLFETVDWRQLFDTIPSPEQIFDQDGFLYLYDPARGFYIFDYYGAFKNKLAFTNWDGPMVAGTTLYGFGQTELYSYRTGSMVLKTYPLPVFFGKPAAIKAKNGKVYLLRKEGIDVYRVK